MKKILIVLFLFVSNYSYPQITSTWQVQNSFGYVNDIYFLNAQTGFAVCEGGNILKTTNSGVNWSWIPSPSRAYSLKRIFVFGETGLILTAGYDLMFSTNGGNNWKVHPSMTISQAKDVKLINEQTGWITHYDGISKTTNGGINWVIINSSQNFERFHFFNENTGIGIRDNKVYKTTNSGANWNVIYEVSTGELYEISFINENTGYVCGQSRQIIKTTNQGLNWTSVHSGKYSTIDILALSENEIYATGTGNNYMLSTNGGMNWVLKPMNGIYEEDFPYTLTKGGNNLVFAGSGIFVSTNNGTNWFYSRHSVFTSPFYSDNFDVNFINQSTGYIAATKYVQMDHNGFVFKTTNGGINWNAAYSVFDRILSVSFVNDLTGWIISETSSIASAYISKTINGGVNFVTQVPGPPSPYKNNIYAKDANSVYASGTGLWLTSNSGVNWNLSYVNALTNKFDISEDNQNIYVACDEGKFIKSTNGGVNFSVIQLSPFENFQDVDFINNLTGYMIGLEPYDIYKTTNGGLNWSTVRLDTNASKYAISFINEQTGWIVGSRGSMFYTSNSGSDWKYVKAPVNQDLYDITFVNSNTGYCVGANGTILYTNNGGIINVKNENVIEEKSYLLLKNYPNPFNPSTTISFSIPQDDNYELFIYDINGKLIDKIFNRQFAKGNYEISWNAESLPSGVYFAKLKNEKLSTTIKLLLVK